MTSGATDRSSAAVRLLLVMTSESVFVRFSSLSSSSPILKHLAQSRVEVRVPQPGDCCLFSILPTDATSFCGEAGAQWPVPGKFISTAHRGHLEPQVELEFGSGPCPTRRPCTSVLQGLALRASLCRERKCLSGRAMISSCPDNERKAAAVIWLCRLSKQAMQATLCARTVSS